MEFGSKNPAVTLAAFYNPASAQLLNVLARDAIVRTLTITGGADLAEPFAIGESGALPKGSVVVIDDQSPGQLKQSTHEYDTRVAGIISGANGINPGHFAHAKRRERIRPASRADGPRLCPRGCEFRSEQTRRLAHHLGDSRPRPESN